MRKSSCVPVSFNPRTYIRYDQGAAYAKTLAETFQSTYLYKVRQRLLILIVFTFVFQSTYLYKVRHNQNVSDLRSYQFQSTYLYKVRHNRASNISRRNSFNPRTYIRYDFMPMMFPIQTKMFQSTYLYKVRPVPRFFLQRNYCFNPRTYIRYDCITNNANIYSLLSMHLCDNKLFGFFIDEIKLIGVFNRLIINDCENSSFLLMLNVRKQLYYKFIFYIIGCDDTYVFNSFRIIISQEIETNTIFFMIDDIR